MNNKKIIQFIFIFSIFLVVAAWGISWIITSRADYYRILENKADDLLIFKKDYFLTNIVLKQPNLLYKEKKYLEKTFPYLKEINFLIAEKGQYIIKEFDLKAPTIRNKLVLGKVYPLFLNNILVGGVQIILEDKKLKDSIYINTIFLLLICLLFIGLGYYIIKNLNLEEIIKEKTNELNYNISYIIHELKNPITAINNIAYILKDCNENKNLINRIRKLSEEMEEKIANIINIQNLDFNIMSQKIELINLYEFISEIVKKLYYIKTENEIQIENNIEKNINIKLPKEIVQIILSNIISNSIKYTIEGNIVIESTISNREIEITITDTGIGIPPEDKEKIFDVFYRSENAKKEKIKGTGIGLALVKKAIDQLNWNIIIESPVKDNKGTRVRIKIPFDKNS